jgi:hypothetical protein
MMTDREREMQQKRNRKYAALNRDKLKFIQKRYREKHRERVRDRGRRWRDENREKSREYGRKWMQEYREKNRDKILASRRAWYKANSLKERKRSSEFGKKNRAKITASTRDYKRTYAKIPRVRLRQSLSRRIYHALNRKIYSVRTALLLGCPFDDFLLYLESKFEVGMTWENYGKRSSISRSRNISADASTSQIFSQCLRVRICKRVRRSRQTNSIFYEN